MQSLLTKFCCLSSGKLQSEPVKTGLHGIIPKGIEGLFHWFRKDHVHKLLVYATLVVQCLDCLRFFNLCSFQQSSKKHNGGTSWHDPKMRKDTGFLHFCCSW